MHDRHLACLFELADKAYGTAKIPKVEEWLRQKKEEREELARRTAQWQDQAIQKYKDYRNSGVAFSVTLISLSSALILWTYNLFTGNWSSPILS